MAKLSLKKVVKPYLQSLDCARSLTVWLLYLHGEHDQLVDLKCAPSDYADLESFRSAYRATGLLAKYPSLNVSVDPKQRAIESFDGAEQACRAANERWILASSGVKPWSEASSWIFHEARKIIHSVLGSDPFSSSARAKAFNEGFCWGPGSTSAVSGSRVSAADKLEVKPEATASLHHLVPVPKVLAQIPSWFFCHSCDTPAGPGSSIAVNWTVVHGNKVTFVPKNAKTHRSIAVEPHLNVMAQKGCGALIRFLLKRHGLDLDSDHQNIMMARQGSTDGSYSTLDLKSASDTISREVVRALLPQTWFLLLDACRSHRYLHPVTEEWTTYEKFSSMGNGFTFELESLIFWALARATCRHHGLSEDVAVFGDDIVCPSLISPTLVGVLGDAGFQTNVDKSFIDGPFRESCGGDFYLGTHVTRFQMKAEICERELVVLHNKATEASLLPFGRDATFAPFIYRLRSLLKEQGASYGLGPYGLDGCLWSDWDEGSPPYSKRYWERYHAVAWRVHREVFLPRLRRATSILDVTSRLWQAEYLPKPLSPWSAPVSVSATAGRPLREQGTWVFREVLVQDFPLMGPFLGPFHH